MALVVTAAELDRYLGLAGSIDPDRAALVIQLVLDDAESVLTPLPDNALGVILTAAGRLYGNPHGHTAESTGPFSVSHRLPGAYLTRRERVRLRRLAGRFKGAYTIDPTPKTAHSNGAGPAVPRTPDSSAYGGIPGEEGGIE